MDFNKIRKAYEPYCEEAKFCLFFDILVGLITSTIFISAKILFLLWAIPVYFVIEIFVNYRIAILAFVEKRKETYITKRLRITSVHIEYSASGRWGSVLPGLYPRNLQMQRYKLTCVGENGETITLRCAMSNAKRNMLNKLLVQTKTLEISYGSLSKIVIKFDGPQDAVRSLDRHF